jgi:hypothetical protein
MVSQMNKNVVLAYEKGYRVKNGEVVSPFSGNARNLGIHARRNYKRYRFSIRDAAGKKVYPVEVHKLVAYQKYGDKMFEPGIQVRHLDNNSLNNLEDNVAIGTKSENEMDKPKEVRQRTSVNAATAIRKFTDLEMDEIRKFHTSYKETMEEFDITSKGTLHYILNTEYQTKV